jgi:2-methylcitrate dehydratase PrpD
MGATESIAKWVVNTNYEDIPPDAIRVANESCFDLLGVILAGSAQPVGEIIQQYTKDLGGTPEATVLASGLKTSLANTALANGTMGHALDYDDFGGFGHPTVAIFPALLALGENTGATGRDLMEAYVVGCEVGLALQHATKYNQMEKGFHATAVIGRMACTAACAKLLNLDEQQTVTALGIAGSMSSGLIHNFGTMTKPLHAGLVGRDGVTAVQLAQRGLTSGQQVVEHPLGFTATVLGTGIYDLNNMAENLGNPFRVQDALMIKKYPCCGGNHAMLDSLFSLMREHDFTYDDVVEAEVDQSFLSIVMLYEEPDDELKGKFSARYNVAAALVDGEVAIPTFSQEKIDDPQIQEAMGKVRNRVMAKAEEGLTDATQGLPIRIKLKDGRVVEHRTARANILGAQGNPWGFENIKNKFQVNASLALPEDRVDNTIDAWTDITQVADLAETIQRTLVR